MQTDTVLSIFGEQVEILVSSKSTNYSFCVGMQTSPPGGGPPPHLHEREEEISIVIEGQYEFFDRDKWVPFAKGEVKTSLRGNYHAFRNSGTTDGKVLFMTNSGGLDEYFAEISSLVIPRDLDRLVEISKHYGYVFLSQAP